MEGTHRALYRHHTAPKMLYKAPHSPIHRYIQIPMGWGRRRGLVANVSANSARCTLPSLDSFPGFNYILCHLEFLTHRPQIYSSPGLSPHKCVNHQKCINNFTYDIHLASVWHDKLWKASEVTKKN